MTPPPQAPYPLPYIAIPSENIASHLVDMAQRQPNTPAILAQPQRNAQGKLHYTTCTFQQLHEQSDTLARGFATLGIHPGMRTALCVRPGLDFFAITFALFKLSAVPVLIDPGIGLRNFGRCLSQAQPTAFIGTPLAHLARRLLGWAKATARIQITTGHFGGTSLKTIIKNGTTPPDNSSFSIQHSALETAAILFTSGSTGPAKGVVYTHSNFDAQVRSLRDTYHIQPGEIDLATFPLFGLFGPALGMTTVIPDMDFTRPGFVDPRHIIEPIQQLGITNMFGSPALLERVGQWGVQHPIKLPSLRRVISAGAPVPASVLAQFTTMLQPDVQIFTPYGATESLPVCSIGSTEILSETTALTDQGHGVCVGKVAGTFQVPSARRPQVAPQDTPQDTSTNGTRSVPATLPSKLPDAMQVRIIKITDAPIPTWSDDLLLPPNQIGEIFVQGPVVTAEYFNRPDATAAAKIPTPYDTFPFGHRMGDVGYFDSLGRLWFCGRKSHRVKLPIGDLFTIPVEAIFNTHPLVRRSALVGITRDGTLQSVVCIELRPNTTRAQRRQLSAQLRTLATQYPHTKEITDFLIHPRFPVDIRHNAKIGREKLTLWADRKLP